MELARVAPVWLESSYDPVSPINEGITSLDEPGKQKMSRW